MCRARRENSDRGAFTTPRVSLNLSALDHRPIKFDELSSDYETELIERAVRAQIRRGERSLEHVEVICLMVSVSTSTLEDHAPYPSTGTRTPSTPSNAKSLLRLRHTDLLNQNHINFRPRNLSIK